VPALVLSWVDVCSEKAAALGAASKWLSKPRTPSSKSPQTPLKAPKGAQRPYQLYSVDKALKSLRGAPVASEGWVGGRLGEPVVGWQVAVGEVSGSYADHPYHHPGIIVRTSGEVVSVPGGALRQLGSTGDWRGEALPPHEGPAVALDGYKAAERVLADLVVEHGLG